MFITPSFKKSLIVEQFQGNYLKWSKLRFGFTPLLFVQVVLALQFTPLKGWPTL